MDPLSDIALVSFPERVRDSGLPEIPGQTLVSTLLDYEHADHTRTAHQMASPSNVEMRPEIGRISIFEQAWLVKSLSPGGTYRK